MNQPLEKSVYYLLITYSEWTSWVDLEHLRINPKRIVEWKDENTPEINLEQIIFNDHAPFVNLLMLDSYLIVEIDTSEATKDIYLTKTSHKIFPYKSCRKLIPFNERSRNILYSESSRRQIEINYPVFEPAITSLLARKMAIRDLAIAMQAYKEVSQYELNPKERKYWMNIFNLYHLGATTEKEETMYKSIEKLFLIDPNSMKLSSKFQSNNRLWALDLLIRYLESLNLDKGEDSNNIDNIKLLLAKANPNTSNLEDIEKKASNLYKKIKISQLPEFWVVYPYLLARVKQGDDEIRYAHVKESLDLISSLKKNPIFLFLMTLKSEPHKFTALKREILFGRQEVSPPEQQMASSVTPPTADMSSNYPATPPEQPVASSATPPTADMSSNHPATPPEHSAPPSGGSPTSDQIDEQNRQSRDIPLPWEEPSKLIE